MKSINWSDHLLNFVAVILGVSLAFYISSSSEVAKEEEEISQVMSSLMEELAQDHRNYTEYQIPFQENQSAMISEVLEKLMSGDTDSLSTKLEASMNINNYQPNDLTFRSITTSGKLDLISDFELRMVISNYYEALAVECEHRNMAQTDFYMDHLLPWLIANTSLVEPDASKLIKNQEFINLLVIYQAFIENKLSHYRLIAKESQALQMKLKETMYNGK